MLKRVLQVVLLLLLLGAAAIGGYLFLGSDQTRDVYSFVPGDFVYVIESDRPVKDWQELSSSKVWRYLKGNNYFGEVTASADYLDSLLNNNKALVNVIKLGDLVVSAHVVDRDAYEFIILVDLKGLSRVGKLGAGLSALFQSLDYEVSTSSYFSNTIFNLKDPESGQVLYLTAMDNVLVASYRENLLKRAIEQTEKPSILSEPDFLKVREELGKGDIYSVYLNYRLLEDYIKIYTQEMPVLMSGLDEVLAYSSLDLEVEDDKLELKGYTKQVDSILSVLNIFKDMGKGRVMADEVLPANTAFFASIGTDDVKDFYDRFSQYYSQQKPEDYADFIKNKERIENFLKISVEDNFMSWMTDEIITAAVPTDPQSKNYAYYGLLHFDDYEEAKRNMDFIAEQVRKKTPAKFLEVEHQGVPIRYLELKGFFKLFLKKMFARIERPHYCFVGDYVVFSNDIPSLEYIIDQYLGQNTLEYDHDYEDFFKKFERRSNVFAYINNAHFYNFLRSNVDYEYQVELYENKSYLMAFPRMGLQLYPGGGMYRTYMYADFIPIEGNE